MKTVYVLELSEEGQDSSSYSHATELGMFRRGATTIRDLWEDDHENPFMGSGGDAGTENATMRRYCSPEDYAENLPKVRDMMAREDYEGLVQWWQGWGHELEVCPLHVWWEAEQLGD